LLHPQKYFIPHAPELERLGAERAMDPSQSIALLFSPESPRGRKWLLLVMQLADYVIQASRR
jgi:hypothetical protein